MFAINNDESLLARPISRDGAARTADREKSRRLVGLRQLANLSVATARLSLLSPERSQSFPSVLRALNLLLGLAKGSEIFPYALHTLFIQDLDHWLIAL